MANDHRGILDPAAGFRHFRLDRQEPARDLAPFVEGHWVVEWDLGGRAPYRAAVLPHPCFHLVAEDGGTFLYGVGGNRFERRLAGRGGAVGTKFRPGGARPFLGAPAWTFTDRSLTARAAFGAEPARRGDPAGQVAALEALLRERLPDPDPDPDIDLIGDVVETMGAEPALAVAEVAERHGLSARSLQRLFRDKVGVSPKWVLRRLRLHEAARRVDEGAASGAAGIALELGYFDQAHFINEFRASVGRTPGRYARSATSGG
jgi:AraC-like DNA-binding protein